MYMPAGTRSLGGGVRTLAEHERRTNEADADILRDAAGALRDAHDQLSTTDPRLKQWADQLSEEACSLEEARETRV